MQSQVEWPDELDALIAAPEHHFLLFENEFVRVLDTTLPPGETVPLHTHRWPGTLYVISFSHFVRRNRAGEVVIDSRTTGGAAPGSAQWAAPRPPHTLENVGESVFRGISVELKKFV